MRAAAVIIALWPAAALAQAPVSLPAGCEAYVTVQKRSCIVSHQFRCAGDPEGHQRRVDYDDSGMTYMGMIDAETRWIESHHIRVSNLERLEPGAADPASLSDLIETGADTWDFRMISERYGFTRYRGYDQLTGNQLVVDGVTLDETTFEVDAIDEYGDTLWSVTGTEYIHRDWRTFLSGQRIVTTPDETYETDGRPVEFIFPGEPGFLATTPRYDCGQIMSKGR